MTRGPVSVTSTIVSVWPRAAITKMGWPIGLAERMRPGTVFEFSPFNGYAVPVVPSQGSASQPTVLLARLLASPRAMQPAPSWFVWAADIEASANSCAMQVQAAPAPHAA